MVDGRGDLRMDRSSVSRRGGCWDDSLHYIRRPVAQFFRGAIGLGDETEGLAMRGRFMEIWGASYPGVSATTVGL